MLKRPTAHQTEIEMITLESLVPADHLLRKVDAAIDFGFIRDLTEGLYCPDNGRLPIAPEVLFKALFVGYLFGIRSERQLMREIEVNVAYRWFLGLRLTDKVFDASTFSQNRRRRFDVELVAKSRANYCDALYDAVCADRAAHGKRPLKPKPHEPQIKETKISRTDPDAGYMVRDGKPKGFFYLDQRTVDSKHNIITDTTAGNVHDSIPYLGRLDPQRERFDLDAKAVGLDAGYASAPIAQGLEERDVLGVTGYLRPSGRKGMIRKREFTFDPDANVYRCPEGQKTVSRHVWADARERTDANRLTDWGKRLYARRKETVERSFADAKQLFGHRYARYRGLTGVKWQCLLAATAQNIKKIAIMMDAKGKASPV